MKMIKLTGISIALCLFYFAPTSYSQVLCKNCGLVVVEKKFYNKQSKQYFSSQEYWADLKIWYKDSLLIQQIVGTSIHTDIYGKETRTVAIHHYTFIDLRSKSFYDYKTFSDTAKIDSVYTQADSIGVSGGWNFYANHPYYPVEPIKEMEDTIINNILYKRIIFITEIKLAAGALRRRTVAYMRCDKKSMFQYGKDLSAKLGCPIVKMQILPTEQDPGTISEIDFVADTLTKAELKVFAAWERNQKNHPVIRR